MFSLFYGLWKYVFSKTEFHVLILGIDKAGKTTLLEKFKSLYSNLEGLPPDRIVPTVGLNIGRLEASNAKLVFWDLGGQIGLRTIWEKYYEEAHAIIYVIDAASPSCFEDSKSALEKALRHEDLPMKHGHAEMARVSVSDTCRTPTRDGHAPTRVGHACSSSDTRISIQTLGHVTDTCWTYGTFLEPSQPKNSIDISISKS